ARLRCPPGRRRHAVGGGERILDRGGARRLRCPLQRFDHAPHPPPAGGGPQRGPPRRGALPRSELRGGLPRRRGPDGDHGHHRRPDRGPGDRRGRSLHRTRPPPHARPGPPRPEVHLRSPALHRRAPVTPPPPLSLLHFRLPTSALRLPTLPVQVSTLDIPVPIICGPMSPPSVLAGSANPHKLTEIREILSGYGVEVAGPWILPYPVRVVE